MTDADVDGAHIRTLLLTLFYRYFPDLITQGHIYIAQPPLYKVQYGKDFKYAFSEEQLENSKKNFIERAAERKKTSHEKKGQPPTKEHTGENDEDDSSAQTGPKIIIQRYKGLGEMNPEQLWETTMDPKTRILKKVTIDDVVKTDTVFEVLMGSSVEQRKHFIQVHAKSVKNIDI